MPAVSYSFTFDGAQLQVAGTTTFDPLPGPGEPFGVFTSLSALVIMSLLTDARAEGGDVVPDPTGDPVDRGGWWGDTYAGEVGTAGVEGDRWGSKLWLWRRSRATRETINGIRSAIEAALAWMVTDEICERVEVEAERVEVAQGRPYVAGGVRLVRGEARRHAELLADVE